MLVHQCMNLEGRWGGNDTVPPKQEVRDYQRHKTQKFKHEQESKETFSSQNETLIPRAEAMDARDPIF